MRKLEWLWSIFALFIYAAAGLPCVAGLVYCSSLSMVSRVFAVSLWVAFSPFLFTLTLILISGFFHRLAPYPKEGVYPPTSQGRRGQVLLWTIHAGIVNLVRVPGLLRLVHAQPLLRRLYYGLSGAKIHPSVVISLDTAIFDPFMVEIDEGTKIGEFVHISGHYSDPKRVVIAKTRIGKNAVIGGGSRIIPGAVIEDGAFVRARSVVLPEWAKARRS